MTNTLKVSLEEISELVLGLLNDGIDVKINITGVSMVPMLFPNRDCVVLRKVNGESVKVNDVILYKRDNGDYVLHRVWKVIENEFVMVGDGQRVLERGIYNENILAKVISFTRKGKVCNVENKKYKFYIFIWRLVRLFRTKINKLFFGKYLR